MTDPFNTPMPHDPPFDADGAMLDFALPWDAAIPNESAATDELPGMLPDWLSPAAGGSNDSDSQEEDSFDLMGLLGLSAAPAMESQPEPEIPPVAANVPEPFPEVTNGPPATFRMPWEEPDESSSEALAAPSKSGELSTVLDKYDASWLTEADAEPLPELFPVQRTPEPSAVTAAASVVVSQAANRTEEDVRPPVYDGPEDPYVVLHLGGTDYAVELSGIVEIGKRPPAVPLPHVPAWLLGLANLRGDIVSVVDLRTYFGFPAVRGTDERMIVLRSETGLTAGLLVDGVRGIRRIPAAAERRPVTERDTPLTPYLKQRIDHNDRLLPVLDLSRLLAADAFAPEAFPA